MSDVSGQLPVVGCQLLLAGGQWRTHAEQSEQAHRLLEQLVGCCVVEHDDDGAPYLADHPNLHVSISHCREAVAVAVREEGPVGIDIECRRKVSRGLMERVCTEEELAAIDTSGDPEMVFLRFWTRKEAVLKCRRTGIKGFGSMVEASTATDCEVVEIDTGIPDVVAAMATAVSPYESRRD